MIKCTRVEIKPSLSAYNEQKWVSSSIFMHIFYVCVHFFLESGPDKILGPTIGGRAPTPCPPHQIRPWLKCREKRHQGKLKLWRNLHIMNATQKHTIHSSLLTTHECYSSFQITIHLSIHSSLQVVIHLIHKAMNCWNMHWLRSLLRSLHFQIHWHIWLLWKKSLLTMAFASKTCINSPIKVTFHDHSWILLHESLSLLNSVLHHFWSISILRSSIPLNC